MLPFVPPMPPMLRHPAKFRRRRPDRDPRSCTLDQVRTGDEQAIAEAIGAP